MCRWHTDVLSHPDHYSTHPPHHVYAKGPVMVLIDHHHFRSVVIDHFIPEIRLFQTLTLKIQCHGYGQTTKACSLSGIQLICFLFISHQWNQQFLRCSYLKQILIQGHGWGQISRPHSWLSIQPKIWPIECLKNTSENFKKSQKRFQ